MTDSAVYPSSPEAERAILGAILLSPDAINQAVDLLTPHDFYRDPHRIIYESMLQLSSESRVIDVLTVADHLGGRGELARVGGVAELGMLAGETGTAANIEAHCRLVSEKSQLRRLLGATETIRKSVYTSGLATREIVDQAEREIFEIGQRRGAREPIAIDGDVLGKTFDRIEQLRTLKGKRTGVTTGLIDLDRKTSGFQKSDLFILAGRPSMGKSSLAINMMEAVACEEKKPVIFFSMEMPTQSVVMRFLASLGRVPYANIQNGRLSHEQLENLSVAAQKLERAKLFIDDSSSLTPMEMRSRCRRLSARIGEVGLVCVDYLQLMSTGRRVDNRVQEVSEISRQLKGIARELEVPVLALSQLSRAPSQRSDHRPQLSDLRDSGAIEQDADIVAFVHRLDYAGTGGSGEGGEAELILQKHRNGETGIVRLVFLGPLMRFENAASEDEFESDTAVMG